MIHKHVNQAFLNKLGNGQIGGHTYLSYAGNDPDGRFWTRTKGLCSSDGTPVDVEVDEVTGESIPVVKPVRFFPMRVAPNGTVYCREVIYDFVGMLEGVGPEILLALPTGTSIFQQFGPDGIIPVRGAQVGATDDFFIKTARGYEARTDFTPTSETPFMQTNIDSIQLKPLGVGIAPEPMGISWLPVAAATLGNLSGSANAEHNEIIGNANGALGLIDGVNPVVGMRLLVDKQVDLTANGLYYIADIGSDHSVWRLHRAIDAALVSNFEVDKFVLVKSGVTRVGEYMELTGEVVEFGTSPIVFGLWSPE
jgi:hypothetical protein